jgi:hypothetical protein
LNLFSCENKKAGGVFFRKKKMSLMEQHSLDSMWFFYPQEMKTISRICKRVISKSQMFQEVREEKHFGRIRSLCKRFEHEWSTIIRKMNHQRFLELDPNSLSERELDSLSEMDFDDPSTSNGPLQDSVDKLKVFAQKGFVSSSSLSEVMEVKIASENIFQECEAERLRIQGCEGVCLRNV